MTVFLFGVNLILLGWCIVMTFQVAIQTLRGIIHDHGVNFFTYDVGLLIAGGLYFYHIGLPI